MAEETEKKVKLGRPQSGIGPTIPLQARLTPEQHAWVTSQPECASEIVRRLINEAMAAQREQAARTGERAEKE